MNKLTFNTDLNVHNLWIGKLKINVQIAPEYLSYFTGSDGTFRKLLIDTSNNNYILDVSNNQNIISTVNGFEVEFSNRRD